MPTAMFEIVSLFHPMLRELREFGHQVHEPHVVDHAKLASAFGDMWMPLDADLRRTVGWYCLHLPHEAGRG